MRVFILCIKKIKDTYIQMVQWEWFFLNWCYNFDLYTLRKCCSHKCISMEWGEEMKPTWMSGSQVDGHYKNFTRDILDFPRICQPSWQLTPCDFSVIYYKSINSSFVSQNCKKTGPGPVRTGNSQDHHTVSNETVQMFDTCVLFLW